MLHAQGLRGLIGEPSILRGMASEHGKIERSSTNHRVVVIDIFMSTSEAVLPAVMLGGGVVDGGRVIAAIILGIIILVRCVFDNEIIELKLTYIL